MDDQSVVRFWLWLLDGQHVERAMWFSWWCGAATAWFITSAYYKRSAHSASPEQQK